HGWWRARSRAWILLRFGHVSVQSTELPKSGLGQSSEDLWQTVLSVAAIYLYTSFRFPTRRTRRAIPYRKFDRQSGSPNTIAPQSGEIAFQRFTQTFRIGVDCDALVQKRDN